MTPGRGWERKEDPVVHELVAAGHALWLEATGPAFSRTGGVQCAMRRAGLWASLRQAERG